MQIIDFLMRFRDTLHATYNQITRYFHNTNYPIGLILGLVLHISCTPPPPNPVPEVTYAQSGDFQDSVSSSVRLYPGFSLSLWAPGPLLASPVSLSIAPDGVAYVSETTRRKSSDIDIRQHRDWMTEDLSLHTLEDTEAFHKKKLALEDGDKNTWQEDFNEDGSHDWRDLLVQSERIRRIWDEDGDGKADASSLYAQGFNEMLTGVAAGIHFQNGEIFLSCAPDLWRLSDTDGDGDADERESISHGYGIHIGYAGHDMSGVTMGPDGKVYWSIGDLGVNTVDQTGKRWAYPHHGAVMRANPDGSDFEVYAFGLRNPQELAFDAFGNLVSVDNDGDHPGEHERIVHILEGSDSGWRTYWQFGKYNQPGESYKIWMDEGLHVPHFKGQPAYLLPPIALADNGPAGLAYNPGTALGDRWNNYFFSSHFTASQANSKIRAFTLAPKGASYEVAEDTAVSIGIVSTGLSFGPDGALYIADWLESYDKKPYGRIWKLDVADSEKASHRAQTSRILGEGVKGKPTAELKDLLANPDMRIRMEAQFELVRKGEKESLKAVATTSQNQFARLHAIWGLGQLARKEEAIGADVVSLLKDPDPEVAAQVAKVLGDARHKAATTALLEAMSRPQARVQYFTAEALGKLGASVAFEPIVALMEKTGDSDPHMRHGLILALSRLATADKIASLHTHTSPDVRIGAVVALRRHRSPKLATFLQDPDVWVRTEAARAIHDDESVPEAMEALAQGLEYNFPEEAFVRRAINANLRLGDAASAQRLANYAHSPQAGSQLKQDALWALSHWPAPSPLDRVEGRFRDQPITQLADAQQAVEPYIAGWLGNSPDEIKSIALEMVAALNPASASPLLPGLVQNKSMGEDVRSAALRAMAATQHPSLQPAMELALKDAQSALRQAAQSLIGQLTISEEEKVAMLSTALDFGDIPEKQQVIQQLGKIKDPQAADLLGKWVEKLKNNDVEPALKLDIFLAASEGVHPELGINLETTLKEQGSDAFYDMALKGGDRRKGRNILIRHETAQCLRCHQIRGYGGIVGPDLTQIGANLSREKLLESLVNPSERIAPGYGTLILTLDEGQKVSGTLIEKNTDSLTLRNGAGELVQYASQQIQTEATGPSAMPSMENILTLTEIRDLVEFLTTLN